jgi:hypothetical protein
VPLETATYISQLVPANPASADALATTQNHLNLIKSVLQTQFPNLGAAPVAATAADLTAGIGGAVATLMANSVTLNPSGSALQTIAGPVAVNDTFNAVAIQQNGVALVPSGLIAMWSGSASAIPAGWLLCNGASGTPNLEGMFVLGAGGAYGVGATGGAASASPTTSSAGSHNHGGQDLIAGPFGMTGSSDVQGTHSHGGATAGALCPSRTSPPTTTTSPPRVRALRLARMPLRSLAPGAPTGTATRAPGVPTPTQFRRMVPTHTTSPSPTPRPTSTAFPQTGPIATQ